MEELSTKVPSVGNLEIAGPLTPMIRMNSEETAQPALGVLSEKDSKTMEPETKAFQANSLLAARTPRMPTTLDDFEVLSTIGTGSYGTCKKVRRKKDGKVLVWKEMDYGSMSEAEKQMLVSEVNLLRELKHEHIVRYYDRIIDRSNTTIYIIMEYCEAGDLATIISKCRKDMSYPEEPFVWKILIQMTLALKECHSRKRNGKAVLHRDLKPANIFLDANNNVKLGDFGLARVLHHETSFAKTYVGTPYYMSPELVNNMSYNEKSDIWSMGCMLYELCALHPPFTGSNQTELNRKIRIGEFSRLPSKFTDELDQTIRKMIRVEVSKRPSIEEILCDPIVMEKREEMERSQSQGQTQTRTSLSSSGERTTALEEELRSKLKKLEVKERELESRERSVALREKLAEEKLRQATELLKQYQRQDSLESNPTSISMDTRLPTTTDLDPVDIHKPLSAAKEPDSPKKKVTFDILNGKENLRQRRFSDYKTTDYARQYEDSYLAELVKRRELRDRLFQAKSRALDLRSDDYEAKYRSRNLLYFR